MRRPAVALWVCLALIATPTAAQQGQRAAPAPAQPAPAPEPPPPVYEPDLLKLAEVMGSLAFLRELCTEPDASVWRTRMAALIETEGTTPARRDRLAGAYNRGFNGFALTYRRCTPAAREAAVRLARDGERLTKRLSVRFGG